MATQLMDCNGWVESRPLGLGLLVKVATSRRRYEQSAIACSGLIGSFDGCIGDQHLKRDAGTGRSWGAMPYAIFVRMATQSTQASRIER